MLVGRADRGRCGGRVRVLRPYACKLGWRDTKAGVVCEVLHAHGIYSASRRVVTVEFKPLGWAGWVMVDNKLADEYPVAIMQIDMARVRIAVHHAGPGPGPKCGARPGAKAGAQAGKCRQEADEPTGGGAVIGIAAAIN